MFHRLDPRTKLAGLFLLLVTIFVHPDKLGVTATGAVVLACAALTGVGWRLWFGVGLRFAWMLGITAAANLLFVRGGSAVIVGGWELPFTSRGLETASLFTAQVAEAVAVSMILTFTTTPAELTRGAERLARPLKRLGVPVDQFGLIGLLALRFLPVLQQEVQATVEAQKSRGVDFASGNLATRTANLVAVLMPALSGALRRADLLASAMTARGFQPGKDRTEFRPLKFSVADYVAAAMVASFFCGRLLVLRWQ